MSALTVATLRLRREIDAARRAFYWRQAKRRLDRVRGLLVNVLEIDERFEIAKAALINVHGQVVTTIAQVEAQAPNGAFKTAILARLNTMRTDLDAARDAAKDA